MEVNLLNQKLSTPSWPDVFQFDVFSVILSKRCVFPTFELSSSPSNSLVMWFIHSAFSLCFFLAIFQSKIFLFLLHLVVGMFLYHLPVVDRIFFRCFEMSSFVCIVLSFVDISLIFLLSPVFSDLFPKVVLLFFFVLPFPFCSYIFLRLSFVLSFWPVFIDFFICVSSQISSLGFDFSFVLF